MPGATQPNAAQVRALRHLTNVINRGRHDGAYAYRIEMIPRHIGPSEVLLSAWTEDTRWFETHSHHVAIIGPRGGVVRHEHHWHNINGSHVRGISHTKKG
jgi:hypothetical protein